MSKVRVLGAGWRVRSGPLAGRPGRGGGTVGAEAPAKAPPIKVKLCGAGLLQQPESRAAGFRLRPAQGRDGLLGSHFARRRKARVAAGGALAVDRDPSAPGHPAVECPGITLRREVAELDESLPTLVATGPLTEGRWPGHHPPPGGELSFYDAAAPIVTAESLDRNRIFAASRYDRGDADYLNCPFNKEEYEAFHAALVSAERAPLHGSTGLTV